MGLEVHIEATERTLLDALDGGADPVAAWGAYRSAHSGVLDYYTSVFGPPDQPEEEVAAAAAAQAATLRRRERDLELDVLAPRVATLLEVPPERVVEAVTFVGWGRAMAWCDDESADPRAYFALERLPRQPHPGARP